MTGHARFRLLQRPEQTRLSAMRGEINGKDGARAEQQTERKAHAQQHTRWQLQAPEIKSQNGHLAQLEDTHIGVMWLRFLACAALPSPTQCQKRNTPIR